MRTPSYRLKLLAVMAVTTLLLIIGYRRPTEQTATTALPRPAPVATRPSSVTATDTTTVAIAPTPAPVRPNALAKASAPIRSAVPVQESPAQATDRPVASAPIPSPAESFPKPASITCAQLVLRSGDLLDAQVTEVGIHEIRYKKCHWTDSPEYVIPRADVLSIRFANGEIERL